MFQTEFVEEIKTHILCPITFFFENGAVYEIVWKNIVEPDKTMWRMAIVCWIPRATNTLLEYVILLLLFHCNNSYTHASL